MSAPAAHTPRSQLTLAATLLGLAVIPGLFLPNGAFAPDLVPDVTRAQSSYRSRPPSNPGKRPFYESVVTKYASAYGVRPELVHAVIQKESRGNPLAVGVAGEQGLMQLMPKTAQELGVRNRFDIDENIRGGVEYLSRLLKRFGDEKKALAAYHTGPGTVSRDGVTPRGHRYASEILTNAKKREEGFQTGRPAHVVGALDTRTGAGVVPRSGPLGKVGAPDRRQAMAAAADVLEGLGGVVSPAIVAGLGTTVEGQRRRTGVPVSLTRSSPSAR